ncbi:MAG: ectoine/hydroxyectoine ABC transporter ATP-binding protein EhuA [Kofleriaceae bacterium]
MTTLDHNPPLLRILGLHKAFDGNPVLRGIDLDVERGEKLVIIGTSGSGKSTLLRILMTLEEPDRGDVEIAGDPMWTMRDRAGARIPASEDHLRRMRRRFGMVFQHFNLFPHMTVLENVAAAPILAKGVARAEAEARARELLAEVGLGDKASARPGKLSGGQKQRVGIARALAMEPEIMLFDEVTSALDPELVGEVLEVMKRLSHKQMTLMIVTHQMRFAKDIAERVIFIDDGTIVEDGPPEQIFENPVELRTRKFLSAVREAT